jgi:O-methyltransferase
LFFLNTVATGQHTAHRRKKLENESQVDELSRIREQYLSLMQACLTGLIYEDRPLKDWLEDTFEHTRGWGKANRIWSTITYHVLKIKRKKEGRSPYGSKHAAAGSRKPPMPVETKFDKILREYGWDWPSHAHTMIGVKRLANVKSLVESVIGNNVPGDLIETGVWRGGACILMRAVLSAYRITNRRVWVADSFEGMPTPDTTAYPDDDGTIFHKFSKLAVSIEEVRRNFKKYGLLDDQVVFLKGWFKNTLPTAPIDRLALIRLDGDLYGSTLTPLNALYDKLSPGGYVIVDDYHVVKPCKQAVHDFCKSRGITPQIEEIDGVGVFWRKTDDESH